MDSSTRKLATPFHPRLGVIDTNDSVDDVIKGQQQSIITPELPSPEAKARKFSEADRKNAGKILKLQNDGNNTCTSADWLKQVEWAKAVLPNFGQESSQEVKTQQKRQSSLKSKRPTAKRSKVIPSRSFADIAKERILIGVIDQGNSDPASRILKSLWKLVETALVEQCFKLLEADSGPPPVCKDIGWFQGNTKIIACQDSRSAQLYKTALSNIGEVYPGAKLTAVDWADVLNRVKIDIPASMKEPEKILKMLQRCNPHLPTHDWRVIQVKSSGSSNQAILFLNKESLALIEAATGELNFGFMTVQVKVNKSAAASGTDFADQNLASELEGLDLDESSSDEIRIEDYRLEDVSDDSQDTIVLEELCI